LPFLLCPKPPPIPNSGNDAAAATATVAATAAAAAAIVEPPPPRITYSVDASPSLFGRAVGVAFSSSGADDIRGSITCRATVESIKATAGSIACRATARRRVLGGSPVGLGRGPTFAAVADTTKAAVGGWAGEPGPVPVPVPVPVFVVNVPVPPTASAFFFALILALRLALMIPDLLGLTHSLVCAATSLALAGTGPLEGDDDR
jgi:hypothetical protein